MVGMSFDSKAERFADVDGDEKKNQMKLWPFFTIIYGAEETFCSSQLEVQIVRSF
jgi:hypothetical protein